MRVAIVGLVLAGCATPHLTAAEWPTTRPAAPCEVTVVDTDGMGPFTRFERYDAAGHLVFSTTRLTYDGRGSEYLAWRGDQLVAVDTYYEQDFRQGNCDVIGGCDEPARRTVARTELAYRGTLLSQIDTRTRTFVMGATAGDWVQADRDHDATQYRWQGTDLVAVDDWTYSFRDGHPVSGQRSDRFKMHSSFEWSGDRLMTYRWFDYVQTFEYDDRGRLVREVLATPKDPRSETTITTWTYDGDRLVQTLRARSFPGATTSQDNQWKYTYDDAQRLVRTESSPAVFQTRSYSASCPPNLAQPNLPSAPRRANLTPCIRTPGYAVNTCD